MFMIRIPNVAKPRTTSRETTRSAFPVGGAGGAARELFIGASTGRSLAASGCFGIMILGVSRRSSRANDLGTDVHFNCW